jgi:hypothetical protein
MCGHLSPASDVMNQHFHGVHVQARVLEQLARAATPPVRGAVSFLLRTPRPSGTPVSPASPSDVALLHNSGARAGVSTPDGHTRSAADTSEPSRKQHVPVTHRAPFASSLESRQPPFEMGPVYCSAVVEPDSAGTSSNSAERSVGLPSINTSALQQVSLLSQKSEAKAQNRMVASLHKVQSPQNKHAVSSTAPRQARDQKDASSPGPEQDQRAADPFGMDKHARRRRSSSTSSGEAPGHPAMAYRRSCSEPSNLSALSSLQVSHDHRRQASSTDNTSPIGKQADVSGACMPRDRHPLNRGDFSSSSQQKGVHSEPTSPRPPEVTRDFTSHTNPSFSFTHTPAGVGASIHVLGNRFERSKEK